MIYFLHSYCNYKTYNKWAGYMVYYRINSDHQLRLFLLNLLKFKILINYWRTHLRLKKIHFSRAFSAWWMNTTLKLSCV